MTVLRKKYLLDIESMVRMMRDHSSPSNPEYYYIHHMTPYTIS